MYTIVEHETRRSRIWHVRVEQHQDPAELRRVRAKAVFPVRRFPRGLSASYARRFHARGYSHQPGNLPEMRKQTLEVTYVYGSYFFSTH